MRLITRGDTSLVFALICGAIVVFRRPLHFFLDLSRDLEARYQVDLLPALFIMSGVFIFHQYRKRQQAAADARASALEAALVRARSEELERMMAFSQALADTLDLTALQQALWRFLPTFARDLPCWVLARQRHAWQTIMLPPASAGDPPIERLESMADRAMSAETMPIAAAEGLVFAGAICIPMRASGALVGVLGVDNAAGLSAAERRTLGTAAALIAIALKNVHLFGTTRDQSLRDGLTGCVNREPALATLDAELRRAMRSAEALSILMLDVDGFKSINDELGHVHGDMFLRAIGAQLTRLLRRSDVAARYGGDEFLIILPGTGLIGAEQVAETLRREIATLRVPIGDRVQTVSISVGVAAAAPDELDVKAFVARADRALYDAKRRGRNRVSLAVTPPPAAAALPLPETVANRPQARAETILIVDDEPLVRDLMRRALGDQGYRVLWAASAAEAMASASSHDGRIHLLVTDVILPDLHGPQLARHILGRRPDMAVLYVSGFIGHGGAGPDTLAPDAPFMQKPFTPSALAAKVRECLNRPVELAGTLTALGAWSAVAPESRH